jgi:preprotein translocase subunit Sec61beta
MLLFWKRIIKMKPQTKESIKFWAEEAWEGTKIVSSVVFGACMLVTGFILATVFNIFGVENLNSNMSSYISSGL